MPEIFIHPFSTANVLLSLYFVYSRRIRPPIKMPNPTPIHPAPSPDRWAHSRSAGKTRENLSASSRIFCSQLAHLWADISMYAVYWIVHPIDPTGGLSIAYKRVACS